MTGRDGDQDDTGRTEILDLFARLLRAKVGVRAVAVAEEQCKAASTAEAAKTWFEILNRLRR